MAAQTLPASTGRYIKVYLITWGIMATGGLGYLASLAWQPELLARPPPVEADQGLQLANRALGEVGSVRNTLGEVQRDLGQMRESLEQHDAQEKAVELRIAALEERATAMPAAATAAEPLPKAKVADKAKGDKGDKGADKAADKPQRPTDGRGAQKNAAAEPPSAQEATPPGIETGSIGAPVIVFGEPVVTPIKSAPFAVQLAAGPSLDAVRTSWNLLLERHGAALASLQPRVVQPRPDGNGFYRLVAGPLPSKAEADKVCTDLGLGRPGCFSTAFAGQPL
jgi:hypothetical protein